MLAMNEATFARRVLRSPIPALACFGARACPGRRALLPALERVAVAHSGRLLVAAVLLEQAPLLAEQLGVMASPTLMVFEGGDRQGQVVGFIQEGLLGLLAEEAANGAVRGDSFWSPVEERFEDSVLIPLLARWGFIAQRQVACALPGRNRAQRGRVDLLVYESAAGAPLTLVESKRHIRGEDELGRAAAQAAAYARSLGLPSFVVAAPRGLWVYRRSGERHACVAHYTSLQVHQAPDAPRQLLIDLRVEQRA